MKRCIALLFCTCVSVRAATFVVTPDGSSGYSNIQDAIDAAPLGETNEIVVHPGVYLETLVVPGTARLSILSTSIWSDAVRDATVVDGQLSDSVLRLSGGGLGELTIAGLSLTGGSNTLGGGVNARAGFQEGNVHVLRCRIHQCRATGTSYNDGGAAVAFTAGNVLSNLIHDNDANELGGGVHSCSGTCGWNIVYGNRADVGGGGLSELTGLAIGNIVSNNYAVMQGGGMRAIRCDIIGNIVVNNYSDRDGGGIFFLERNRLFNNVVSGNVAREDGGGIGDYDSTVKDSVDFINNLICDNIASNYGGGVAHFYNNLHLNNTIAGNVALYGGGGVWRCSESTYINCIIASNSVVVSGQPDVGDVEFSYFVHCCVPGADFLDANSVTVDPHFVAASNSNYRLMADSPCIDAGLDNMHYPVSFVADIDGNLRVSNTIDIGCYEHGAPADRDGDRLADATEPGLGADPARWDTNGDGYPDGLHVERSQGVSEVLTSMLHHVAAGASIMETMARVIPDELVVLEAGTYAGFVLPQYRSELRGATNAAGQPLSVIDGGGTYPVVVLCRQATFPPSRLPTRIADLVLSNGYGAYGGGLSIQRPTFYTELENCAIVHNRAAYGGGVASEGLTSVAMTVFRNCYLAHNTAELWGGGVYGMKLNSDDNEGIRDNVIVHNVASNGGGLAYCEALVQRNTISSNRAQRFGGGIARVLERTRNNLIAANLADSGGGMYDSTKQSDEHVQNNTFVLNVASNAGGGYYLDHTSRVLLLNNIFWSNAASASAQVQLAAGTTNLWHNTIQDWTGVGNATLTGSPLFVDWAAGDYHLGSNDTLQIDSGYLFPTNYPDAVVTHLDRDGLPRVAGGGVDRGCYERYDGDVDFLGSDSRFMLFMEQDGLRYVRLGVVAPPDSRRGVNANGTDTPAAFTPTFYTWPSGGNGDINSASILGNGTPMSQTYMPQYNMYLQPQRLSWGTPVSMSPHWSTPDLGDYRYKTMHARDGVPDGCAGITTGSPPKMVTYTGVSQSSTPAPDKSIDLPLKTVSGSVSLPNDRTLVSGTDAADQPKSVIVDQQMGSVFTATVGPVDNKSWAPAYVDSDGDGQYDDNTVYKFEHGLGQLVMLNAETAQELARYQLPAGTQIGTFYSLSSCPNGVVYGDEYGNHLFVPHKPPSSRGVRVNEGDGTWYTNAFPGNVVAMGGGVSVNVIPEPVLAALVYCLAAGVLGLWIARR